MFGSREETVCLVFKEAGKVRHPVARALLEYLDKKRAHSSDKKVGHKKKEGR